VAVRVTLRGEALAAAALEEGGRRWHVGIDAAA